VIISADNPAGAPGALLLDDDEWMLVGLSLSYFSPVGIGVFHRRKAASKTE
jgi:hypothetical protein